MCRTDEVWCTHSCTMLGPCVRIRHSGTVSLRQAAGLLNSLFGADDVEVLSRLFLELAAKGLALLVKAHGFGEVLHLVIRPSEIEQDRRGGLLVLPE